MSKIFLLKSVLIGTLIVVFICGCGKNTAQYISESESVETESTESIDQMKKYTEENDTEEVLYVYVCGAVCAPGVYTLPKESRICDVFEKAGGFTEDAATDYWNQARILNDGEMIYVPTKEEVEERNLSAESTSGVSKGNTNDSSYEGKININTASKEQLMTIPGIGEAKALAIISYRESNGAFSSIEEVKNVEGIKDGVFSKMKEYIEIN